MAVKDTESPLETAEILVFVIAKCTWRNTHIAQAPCKHFKIICSTKREQEGNLANPGVYGCLVPYEKNNLAANGILNFISRHLCINNS